MHQISETHVLGIVTNTSNCRTLEPDLIGETEEDLEGFSDTLEFQIFHAPRVFLWWNHLHFVQMIVRFAH